MKIWACKSGSLEHLFMLLTSFLPFFSKPWSCNFISLYSVAMLVRKFGDHYNNRKVDKSMEGDIAGVKWNVWHQISSSGDCEPTNQPELLPSTSLPPLILFQGYRWQRRAKLAFLLRSKKCVRHISGDKIIKEKELERQSHTSLQYFKMLVGLQWGVMIPASPGAGTWTCKPLRAETYSSCWHTPTASPCQLSRPQWLILLNSHR